MARQRELLSLASIAEETGISYQTLRGYAVKYVAEIPSEGSGRNTRYPRAAVKVFQRLRRESKPGRKPAGYVPFPAAPAVTVSPPAVPERERTAPAPPQQVVLDTSGIERELAGIRAHLGSIAESLADLVTAQKNAPAAAPVVAVPAPAPAPVLPPAPAPPERPPIPPGARGLLEDDASGGQRRLHSLSKVRGQRGRRPE